MGTTRAETGEAGEAVAEVMAEEAMAGMPARPRHRRRMQRGRLRQTPRYAASRRPTIDADRWRDSFHPPELQRPLPV